MADWSLARPLPDIMGNAMNAFQQGRETATAKRAGNALQAGDTAGAANAYFSQGMNDQGIAVQDRQRTMQRQDAQDQRLAKRDSREDRAFQLEATKQHLTVLKNVRDRKPEDLPAAFQQIAPTLRQMAGSSPEEQAQVDQIIEAVAQNPALLDDVLGIVDNEIKGVVLTAGAQLRHPVTGELLAQAPYAPQYKEVGQGQSLIEINPNDAQQGGTGAGGPMVPIDQVEAQIVQSIPGVQVSSRTRTPEHNARVGGVPDSYHLTGQARDLVPPQGMTTAQLAGQLRGELGSRGYQVIDEGDHVHIEPARRQAGPRVVAQGAPKQKDAPAGFRWTADGNLEAIPGGPGDAAQKAAKITEGQRQSASLAYAAFEGNRRLNELASQGIYKPSTVTSQLINEQNGVTRIIARNDVDRAFVQASKEFLAPILRKDTGAAVTDTELAYYMDTYIPRFEDSPDVLYQKAQARSAALRRVYGTGSAAYKEEYGEPPGFGVMTDPRARQAQGGKPQQPAAKKGGAQAKTNAAPAPNRLKYNPQTGRVE